MIMGIGIDIVHVGRIRHWESVPGLVERFFHPEEVADARSRGNGEPFSLAARFAVTGIPAMMLLDQNGMIVSLNSVGPKLEKEVKRLLVR